LIFNGCANHVEDASIGDYGVEVQFSGSALTNRFDHLASSTLSVEVGELKQIVD
jgi:hypothetical protein